MVDIGASVAENRVEEAIRRGFADYQLGVDLLGYLVVEGIENESVTACIHRADGSQQIAVYLLIALVSEFIVLVLFADSVDERSAQQKGLHRRYCWRYG